MKNIIKSAALVFATISVLFLFAFGANAYTGTEIEDTGLYYEIRDEHAVITDADTDIVNVEIPDFIEGYPVTEIGYRAFFHNEKMENVKIPAGVTKLGIESFQGCAVLKEITLPEDLTEIGHSSFYGCSAIREFVIPEGITRIENGMFTHCKQLEKVTVPDGVTYIGSNTFAGCTSLDNVILPDSVTDLGTYAFRDCTSMKNITLSKNIKKLGTYAFYNCNSLLQITIPEKVTSIGSYAFDRCAHIESIDIPDSVESIGIYAFRYCFRLKSVHIGSGLRDLGSRVLFCSSAVSEITVDENNTVFDSRDNCNAVIHTADNTVVLGCSKTTFPESVTAIGPLAFNGCESLTSLTLPANITSLGAGSFSGCTKLISLDIPDTVTSMYESAFSYCTSLVTVTVGNGLNGIENEAFGHCDKLSDVTLGENVTYIDSLAFAYCPKLNEFVLSDSITDIESTAFKSSGIFDNEANWDGDCFYIGDYLLCCKEEHAGEVIVREGTKFIAGNAFSHCSNITAVSLPDSIKSIGKYAFIACTSLEKMNIPDSVTEIKEGTFFRCTNLVNITISENINKIGDTAFYGCLALTSVKLPDGVTEIGKKAFVDCKELKAITLPEGLNKLDENGLYGIADIYYPLSENEWKLLNTTELGAGYGAHAFKSRIHFNATEDTHIWTEENSATCADDGYIYLKCVCGHVKDELPTSALGHIWSNVPGVAPTCTQTGISESKKCERCGDISGRYVIPANGHRKTTITIPSTCTINGMRYTICMVCGDMSGESVVIPASGHIPGEWEIVVAPTIDTEGKKILRCAVCGEIIEEAVIPKLQVITSSTGVQLVINGEDYDGDVSVDVTSVFDGTSFNLINAAVNNTQSVIFDITMSVDGDESQPNGTLVVRIPMPAGFDAEHSFVYHVNSKTGVIEKMPSHVEDGYIVFETTHFSYYAVVEETPECVSDNICVCNCHKNGLMNFIWKIMNIINRLFGKNSVCACGVKHY